MTKIAAVVCVLFCCSFLVACSPFFPQDSQTLAGPAQVSSLQLVGTIIFEDLEGGFYIFETDAGQRYVPINLTEKYENDGLRVQVKGRIVEGMMGVQMRGPMIEIQSITLL